MRHVGSLRQYLVIGILVFMVAGLLFGLIAENVVRSGALTVLDIEIAEWLHEHSMPALTQCLLILTHLHDPLVISPVAALLTVTLIRKKHWFAGLAFALVVQGGMLLNLLVKQQFHRARPLFDHPLVTLTTYSFPSGHVVASTVFYGALAILLISRTHSPGRIVNLLVMALVMIVLVAFSRLYLGAHYLSDVLAAFVEAVAWIGLCLTLIQTYLLLNKKV